MKYRKVNPLAPELVRPASGNAGYDLAAVHDHLLLPGHWITVETGIAVEIPPGYVGLMRGRSGNAFNNKVLVFEGTIDCTYRGEIKAMLCWLPPPTTDIASLGYIIKAGSRIAQLVIVPYWSADTELVEDLSETTRGESGFGSSGA